MRNYPRLIGGLILLACLAIIIPAAGFAASSSGESSTEASLLKPLGDELAPPIEVGADCRTASETGFDICDDGNARFLSAYQSYGLQNVGYPISRRYMRDGFITQAFQKAILQWRPDTGTVAFKNVFDELSKQGLDERLFSSRQTPYPLPAGWDGNIPFDEVIQKRQALLTRPALRAAYFAASDPLTFFGLPTSEEVDMGNHYAIRLQRAVLQEWKETVPWAAAGEVTIANGGDIAKEMAFLPAFALTTNGTPAAGAVPTPASVPTTAPSEPAATPVPSAPAASTGAPRNLDSRLGALGVSIQEAEVAPGQPYWRIIEVIWHDESEAGGRHSIFVDVLDENGGKIVGHPVRYAWSDGEAILQTEDKPAHEYSSNFPMYAAGQSYNVRVQGLPSDVIHGLGLGDLIKRDWNIHVEYLIKFQRAIK